MTAERCPRCDRDYCPNFPPVRHDGTEGDRDCPVCVASRDCDAHAVDWRARALAAESERDALRADLKAWADELEKSRTGQFIAAEVRRRFLDAPDVGRGGPK